MEALINNQIALELDETKRKREAELLQKAKVKKANEEEVNSRKKPGRKRLEVTESNTKKEKNRVAQRAWRERKEKYVLELEAKIAELENANNKSENEKQQLKLIIEKLRSENTYLKNATSFIFTPTKETQMFMEQNKLKVLQQKNNVKQNGQPIINNQIPLNAQSTLTPSLISTSTDSVPSLASSNVMNENILSESSPELMSELYKLMNIPNPELMTYPDGTQIPPKENNLPMTNNINPNMMTPNSLIDSASSPLCSDVVQNNSNSSLFNMISPLQKDDIIIPNEYPAVPATAPANPNFIIFDQNPNKNIQPTIINQPNLAINPSMVSNPGAIPNTITATIPPQQPMDQNSLLAMSMINNVPTTFASIQQPTMTPAANIPTMNNNVYAVNGLPMSNPVKPIVSGSMNYRTQQPIKEKSQPITDELFNNMINMLHQQQNTNNLDGNDEDDLLIQQINNSARQMYTNPITGIPSPSNGNYLKEHQKQENFGVNVPFTPEDLDSESNKSDYAIKIIPRGIDLPENDNDHSGNDNIKIEDKRTHSTLQFPAEQKPTKLNIPYSVFPRVSHEIVDSFINDAKLSDEEIECLCSELKNKATCKEKLRYLSKNLEVPGWDLKKLERMKHTDETEEEILRSIKTEPGKIQKN
jgi:hypothetical protein